MRARKNGVRGAGAFEIRCGELARSRESDWLSLVEILIRFCRGSAVVLRGFYLQYETEEASELNGYTHSGTLVLG